MKHILTKGLMLIIAIAVLASCDIFGPDKPAGGTITTNDGFFYMMDRDNSNLYQLDGEMRQLKVWNVAEITDNSFIQGITSDGSHIWISASSPATSLFKLDLSGDDPVVLQSFAAPPNGSGTVRDITFDGEYLWAANSGSVALTNPPAIYKINPENGSIEAEYEMPSTEIRGISHIPPNGDQYGRGAAPGIYLGDREANKFWNFRYDRPVFTDAFDAPMPPTGEFTIFPSGITYEILPNGSIHFWTVNSSLSTNYLFQLNRTGDVENMYELNQYMSPGPIVFAIHDASLAPAPDLQSVAPNRGALGTVVDVELHGSAFLDGLSVDFGDGISVANLQYVSNEKATAELTIDASAAPGFRNVTITNPDEQQTTLENAFEVTEEPPVFGFLYVLDFDSNWLYKIREADGGLDQEWDTSVMAQAGSPQGITFDGEFLWMASAGSDRDLIQFETDGTELNEIRRINAPYPGGTGTVRGITWNNGYIWALNSGDNKLYQIDPSNGDILSEVDTPGLQTRGVTFVNDIIYTVDRDDGSVFSWNDAAGEWNSEFTVPLPEGTSPDNRWPIGLDWDGENFWIVISRFADDYVLKVSPDGELLQTIDSPRIGPDILTDVVYVEEE